MARHAFASPSRPASSRAAFASAVSGSADPAALGPVARVIDLVLRYILIALSLGVISTAFKTCTGWVPDQPGPPLAPLPGQPPEDSQDT